MLLAEHCIYPNWSVPAQVRAFMTVRTGGVSREPYDSFNISLLVGDDSSCVRKNRVHLQSMLPTSPCWLMQEHKSNIYYAERTSPALCQQEPPLADAAITHHKNVVLAIQTADCLPILLYDESSQSIAAVHAGWRGLHRGIVPRVIKAMGHDPQNIRVWIGVGISQKKYVVSTEVVQLFLAADPGVKKFFSPCEPGKWQADLQGIAVYQCRQCYIHQMWNHSLCTYTCEGSFFSVRRDGAATGRMATLIWMTP